MNTKIVFFMSPFTAKGKLMKVFTGCYSYHCGILMWDTMNFYDMFWMRRKRSWVDVVSQLDHKKAIFKIVDSPVEIPENYLESMVLNHNTHYGVIDYALFGVRWAYHLVGKTTRNAGGLICSEMVHNDLILHNWHVTYKEVPSPCDLVRALDSIKCVAQFAVGSDITKEQRVAFLEKHGRTA